MRCGERLSGSVLRHERSRWDRQNCFHLQGAIPVITRGPRDHADRDLWLTRYLLDRQVILQNTDGTYGPKGRPDGHYLRANAPGQAYELGALAGMVTSAAAGHRPALGHSELILIATCGTPRHTAAALEVELRIFSRWYAEILRPALDRQPGSSPTGCMSFESCCFEDLVATRRFTEFDSSSSDIAKAHLRR